jgi:hypothetical protein
MGVNKTEEKDSGVLGAEKTKRHLRISPEDHEFCPLQ